ncbi:TetR family transcriptional regulator [Streptomyces orinoci]|uniref:TetR family transcriptional regulator n=1 Tax=Streptomyces orinoci TaxID=67339 RepID=A0ABV3K1I1_STRON|nr:TetR family transcriptional regulator [Streptomyces orinoci]
MAAPRDPEATKARIFDAATAEFAAHGIAGARMDRIAREAKANKQLIYAYFGNKAELFSQVLEKRLTQLAVDVPVDAQDLDGWLDRLMDYHQANPELIRLLYWEGLEYGNGAFPREETRREHYDRKVEAFAEAQRQGAISSDIPAADLLFMLIALVSWPSVQPHMRRLLTGDGEQDRERLRSSIRTAAHRMTRR